MGELLYMKTLVYVGANIGSSLWNMIQNYDVVYSFEPDPEMFIQLEKRFKQFEWVTLVNAACSESDGEVDFYITPNRVSSSLADASSVEKSAEGFSQHVQKIIKVKTINLSNYLQSKGVEEIDTYLSDAQGSDLNILKSIKDYYVDTKKIKTLIIETHGDGIEIYDNLNNQFKEFKKILSNNYNFVHASLGSQGGRIVTEENIPVDEKEWDSCWEVKS